MLLRRCAARAARVAPGPRLAFPGSARTFAAGKANTSKDATRKTKKAFKLKQKKTVAEPDSLWWRKDVVPWQVEATRSLSEMVVSSHASQHPEGHALHASIYGNDDFEISKLLYAAPVAVAVVDSNDKLVYANELFCVGLMRSSYRALIDDNAATELPFTADAATVESVRDDIFLALPEADSASGPQPEEDARLVEVLRWTFSTVAEERFAASEERFDKAYAKARTLTAYVIHKWAFADGTEMPAEAVIEEIDETEVLQMIDDQALFVRRLKDDRGLKNKDPEVLAAVAELLRLKALLN
ncbi:hypothetical protein M885DRAFT_562459 [Pelagophyceae sp. CCMP2097]|nr:hypothetical protein M885DRAFT_562459 [Pelagophyceae sp. CCMP2097]